MFRLDYMDNIISRSDYVDGIIFFFSVWMTNAYICACWVVFPRIALYLFQMPQVQILLVFNFMRGRNEY